MDFPAPRHLKRRRAGSPVLVDGTFALCVLPACPYRRHASPRRRWPSSAPCVEAVRTADTVSDDGPKLDPEAAAFAEAEERWYEHDTPAGLGLGWRLASPRSFLWLPRRLPLEVLRRERSCEFLYLGGWGRPAVAVLARFPGAFAATYLRRGH